jgi:integrase
MTTPKDKNITKINPTSWTERLTATTWKKHKARGVEVTIRCDEIPGFYIRIKPISSKHPNGHRTYIVSGKLGGTGRQIYPSIGNCAVLSFDKAREMARDFKYQIQNGIDPRVAQKRKEGLGITLSDAIQGYADTVKESVAELTYKDYLRKGRIQLKPFSRKTVGEITVADVKQWWKKCPKKRSDYLAVQYAIVVFNDLLSDDIVEQNVFKVAKLSGAMKKTLPALNEVKQHIPMDRMPNYVLAMNNSWEKLGDAMRDLLLFLMLTGKRLGESSTLTWKNVDFKKGTIAFPTTKTNVPDLVSMTPYTLRLMTHRRDNCKVTGNPYVFNAREDFNHKKIHVTDSRSALERVWLAIPEQDRWELEKGNYISNHDLRRTFATATLELGFHMEDKSALLNHAKQGTTDKYSQRSIEYNREKLQTTQYYLNEQAHGGIHNLIVNFYGGNSEHLIMQDEKDIKIVDYEKENKDF